MIALEVGPLYVLFICLKFLNAVDSYQLYDFASVFHLYIGAN